MILKCSQIQYKDILSSWQYGLKTGDKSKLIKIYSRRDENLSSLSNEKSHAVQNERYSDLHFDHKLT